MKLKNINERKGGCLVRNGSKYLLIKKNGEWQIPKGKQKENEPIDQTATRETLEETGIYPNLEQTRPYFYENLTFFLANTEHTKTTPLRKEGITKCDWFELENAMKKIKSKHLPVLVHFSQHIQK